VIARELAPAHRHLAWKQVSLFACLDEQTPLLALDIGEDDNRFCMDRDSIVGLNIIEPHDMAIWKIYPHCVVDRCLQILVNKKNLLTLRISEKGAELTGR